MKYLSKPVDCWLVFRTCIKKSSQAITTEFFELVFIFANWGLSCDIPLLPI